MKASNIFTAGLVRDEKRGALCSCTPVLFCSGFFCIKRKENNILKGESKLESSAK